MTVTTRNQQILCAYALLFTVAAGVIVLDPVGKRIEPELADVAIPQLALESRPTDAQPGSEFRLAGQFALPASVQR